MSTLILVGLQNSGTARKLAGLQMETGECLGASMIQVGAWDPLTEHLFLLITMTIREDMEVEEMLKIPRPPRSTLQLSASCWHL